MVDILTILLVIMLMCVGVGLGATLQVDDFKQAMRKPRAFALGMLCQFGFMPLAAYAFTRLFDFSDDFSIGVMLVGMAPGGITSNLFAYWTAGDVALSVSMSAASTLLAFGMIPLLTLLYIDVGGLAGDGVEIPYTNIVISLLLLVLPCFIGVYVKTKSAKYAKILEKVGSIVGIVFLLAALIYGTVDNTDLFDQGAGVWFVAFALQIFGTAFGYFSGLPLGLSRRDRRTVALETGIQNSTLSIAIVGLSFNGDSTAEKARRDEILEYPLLYSFAYVINSTWIVMLFRYYLVPRDPEVTVPDVRSSIGGAKHEDDHEDIEFSPTRDDDGESAAQV